jgi:hypothetical protein
LLEAPAHAGAIVGGDAVTWSAVRTINPNLNGRALQRTRFAELDEFESLVRDPAANTLEERVGSHQDGAKKNVGELPHIVTSLLELPLQRGKYRAGAGFRQLAELEDRLTPTHPRAS